MPLLSLAADDKLSDSHRRSLYKIGGIAALAAGILFRRNLAAEIGIFNQKPVLDTVNGWFELLQQNRTLGLVYLNILDVVNYVLVGIMFLALYAVLRRVGWSYTVIAATFGIVGITVYFASNTAFSMLSLSNQYAAAATEAQKTLLLAAGQALLSINRFSDSGAFPGTGGYISLFLVALAGLMTSMVMARSHVFSRTTAYVGIIANVLDLFYCILFAFVPAVENKLLSVCFIPAAGLFLMIWHIMVGWKLYRLGCFKEKQADASGSGECL